MEVHHHAHTARRKWTHYFWEFFMLFLAVTLGFFMENQREHYIEKNRANKYLDGLLIDVSSNNEALDSLIKENDILKKKCDTLIQWLLNDSATIDRFSFAKKLVPANIRVFINRNENFEQMKSSGTLRYLDNTVLLQKILGYQHSATLAEWRSNENERKLFFERYVPAIERNLDMACMQLNMTSDKTSQFNLLPHIDVLRGEEAKKFRNEIGNMLLIRTRTITVSMRTYYQLRDEGRRLVEEIKKEMQ